MVPHVEEEWMDTWIPATMRACGFHQNHRSTNQEMLPHSTCEGSRMQSLLNTVSPLYVFFRTLEECVLPGEAR